MGSFMTSDKSGYFWFLLGYLQDNNIYVRDNRLLPYTPGKPQTYVDFYPQFYGETPTAKVTFKINGQQVAQALVSQVSGIVYADIPVQLGKFTLTTWLGTALLKTEEFISKNFAMLLGSGPVLQRTPCRPASRGSEPKLPNHPIRQPIRSRWRQFQLSSAAGMDTSTIQGRLAWRVRARYTCGGPDGNHTGGNIRGRGSRDLPAPPDWAHLWRQSLDG